METNSNPARLNVPKSLLGMSLPDLTTIMAGLAQKPYRARQLFEALYRQRISTLEEVSVLPADLRRSIASAGYITGTPQIVQTARSIDGTERYLMQMADGETVETVWMPDGDGGERGDGSPAGSEEEEATPSFRRSTICVSSQVGCAVNCHFCLTARLGIRRNLSAGEIAGQVTAVLNRHNVNLGSARGTGNTARGTGNTARGTGKAARGTGKAARGNGTTARINLVFMGMGEPFLNYAAFMQAVRLLVEGVGIPESRMTVSTSGIEPAIRAFASETIRPKLALSLNASNDSVRESIMPITRKWNIAQLVDAVRTIPLRTREWVPFEYVRLGGINDQPVHAREVLALLNGMRAKFNLIVWNPGPGIAYTQPSPEAVASFQKTLIAAGMPTYIRRPRGRDIYAACGQLKRTLDHSQSLAPSLVSPALIAIGTLSA